MTNPKRERPKLDALTSLRFFAASSVFLFHYARGLPNSPRWLLSLASHGADAVTFFFVLSGFILAYSYVDQGEPSSIRGTRRSFYVSRIARIYPLYLCALIIAFPLYIYGTVRGRDGPGGTILGLALVPAMVQAWIPQAAIKWNTPAWSLSVEAAFYVLLPFVLARERRWAGKALLLLSLTLVCASWGAREWLRKIEIDGSAAGGDNWRNFLAYFPLFHLPSFLLGTALGWLFLDSSQGNCPPRRFLFWLALLALGAVAAGRGILPFYVDSSLAFILLFSAVIYLGAKASVAGKDPVLGSALLVLLGDASYAMYILQAPLSAWFELLLKKAVHIADWTNSPRLVCAFFVLLVATSLASFQWIEKPCRRFIQQRLREPAPVRAVQDDLVA